MLISHRIATAAAGLLLLVALPAQAQTNLPARYVTLEAGLNAENADDIDGKSFGGGASFGVPFADRWTTEVAFWFPAFIKTGPREFGHQHRDILINGAVIRSFGSGSIRPFALFGLSAGYTQTRFFNCIAMRPRSGSGELVTTVVDCREPDVVRREEDRFGSFTLFFLAGGGADIPLSDRISLVPQVRFDASVGTIITRPTIGVKIAF